MKKEKRVKPPGLFEAFERLSYGSDFYDYGRFHMLEVRSRYRRAVLAGNWRKARWIVARETVRLFGWIWVPQLIKLFVLWTKFRGS